MTTDSQTKLFKFCKNTWMCLVFSSVLSPLGLLFQAKLCPLQHSYVGILTPRTSEFNCIWRQDLWRGPFSFNEVMRRHPNPVWLVSLSKEIQTPMCTEGRLREDTRRKERSCPQAKETDLRRDQPYSQLDVEFQPPERWDNKFLLFKPHSL